MPHCAAPWSMNAWRNAVRQPGAAAASDSTVVTARPALADRYQAGAHLLAVEQHRAGAAIAGVAADLGAGEPSFVAQAVGKPRGGRAADFDRAPVDVERIAWAIAAPMDSRRFIGRPSDGRRSRRGRGAPVRPPPRGDRQPCHASSIGRGREGRSGVDASSARRAAHAAPKRAHPRPGRRTAAAEQAPIATPHCGAIVDVEVERRRDRRDRDDQVAPVAQLQEARHRARERRGRSRRQELVGRDRGAAIAERRRQRHRRTPRTLASSPARRARALPAPVGGRRRVAEFPPIVACFWIWMPPTCAPPAAARPARIRRARRSRPRRERAEAPRQRAGVAAGAMPRSRKPRSSSDSRTATDARR